MEKIFLDSLMRPHNRKLCYAEKQINLSKLLGEPERAQPSGVAEDFLYVRTYVCTMDTTISDYIIVRACVLLYLAMQQRRFCCNDVQDRLFLAAL